MGWFKNLKKNSGLRVRTLKAGQRLPAIVLFLVLLLDVYLVSILFQGMGWTSDKVSAPVEKINPEILDLAKNPSKLFPSKIHLGEPDRANRVWGLRANQRPDVGRYVAYNQYNCEHLSVDVYRYEQEYRLRSFSHDREYRGFGPSKTAQKLKAAFQKDWVHSDNVHRWVSGLEKLGDDIQRYDNRIDGLVSNYDSMLRERSANLDKDRSILPGNADTILAEILSTRQKLEEAIDSRNSLVDNIPSEVREVYDTLVALAPKIINEDNNNYRWYAFWVNVAQLLFILPVMAVAILWHRRNMRSASAEVGTLVSSHIIYVTAVPVLAKIIEMVNYIMPYRLLADLFTWVWNAGLQFVWSYVLIVLGVLIIFGLARLVLNHSKKTKAKFYLRCLERNLCPKTGRPLPPGCRYSPYTGEALKVKTEYGDAYRYAPYNSQTGEENPEWSELTK